MYEQDDLTEQLKNVQNESDLVYVLLPDYIFVLLSEAIATHLEKR